MESGEPSIAPTGQIVVYLTVCTIAAYVFLTQCLYCWQNWRRGSPSKDTREQVECILIAATSMAIFLNDILPIRGTWQQPPGYMTYVAITTYGISWILTSCALWFRQRWIYTNHALTHLTNKLSRVVSKYFVVLIVTAGVSLTLCVCVLDYVGVCTKKCHDDLCLAALIVAPFCCQIPLLSLIILPLTKYHRTNSVADAKCLALMKRLLLFTAICLSSDVASAVFYNHKWPHPTTKLLGPQINCCVNVISVIFTSANWKRRLIPCHNIHIFTKHTRGEVVVTAGTMDDANTSKITA